MALSKSQVWRYPKSRSGATQMTKTATPMAMLARGAIHQQNGVTPSVCVRRAVGAFVGQLGKLRPIVNRPDAALAPDGGGSQPPRRLPACPTSRQRFHFYVVHPCLPLTARYLR